MNRNGPSPTLLVALLALGAVVLELGTNAHRTGAAESRPVLASEGFLPDLNRAPGSQPLQGSDSEQRLMRERSGWLNSAPLSIKALRGKVVLVDFWTYSCINSLRNLPYVQTWAARYKAAGLVVIGVHTPEFMFEKSRADVTKAVRELNVTYPVVLDSDYKIWQAFGNEYWPADYIVDRTGRIRHHHFGEGEYAQTESVIRELLRGNGPAVKNASTVRLLQLGVEAAPGNDEGSPETYIGYRHAENFASPQRMARDALTSYAPPAKPALNEWGLAGPWNVGAESAVLGAAAGKIVFRFHSRDLHFVLGPAQSGKPVRFEVKLDGVAPHDDRGVDTASDGTGEIRWPRLYQLIRQKGQLRDRTFEIEFLDPGVRAYAVTFG